MPSGDRIKSQDGLDETGVLGGEVIASGSGDSLLKPSQPEPEANPKAPILGEYVLLSPLGSGGVGQVFKAKHRRMDRLVALKMLKPSVLKDVASVNRFHREVKAADPQAEIGKAGRDHPRIVLAEAVDRAVDLEDRRQVFGLELRGQRAAEQQGALGRLVGRLADADDALDALATRKLVAARQGQAAQSGGAEDQASAGSGHGCGPRRMR